MSRIHGMPLRSLSVGPSRPGPGLRRGFTLIETLVAVILISACGLLGTTLFMATLRIFHEVPQALAIETTVDAARAQLTRDVWNAAALQTSSPQTLTLDLSDGSHIVWQYANGLLTRTVTGPPASSTSLAEHRDYRMPAPVRFVAQGSLVTCTIEPPPPSTEPKVVRDAAAADSMLPPSRGVTFTCQSALLVEGRR